MVILRQSFLDICKGDQVAAFLLANFEYWTNIRLAQIEQEEIKAAQERFYSPNRTLWVYKSLKDLSDDLMGIYGRNKIGDGLAALRELGFLKSRHNPIDPLKRVPQWELQIDAINDAIERIQRKSGRVMPERIGPSGDDMLHGLL